MKIEEISQLMQSAILPGVAKVLAFAGPVRSQISKADAYRLYGRSNVDRWLAERLISLSSKTGKTSKKFLDKILLDGVAASSNRHTYLPTADRKL